MKTNRPSPVLLVFLLVGLAVAAIIILGSTSPATGVTHPTPLPVTLAPPSVSEDTPIIDFALTSLNGETVSLSGYAGRIVFLNFWQTICIPCREEIPTFEAFQAAQAADGPVVLAINIQETPDQITSFLEQYGGKSLQILLDTNADVSTSYGIFAIPTTYVIDGNGIVNYIKLGQMTAADLATYVEALGTPQPTPSLLAD